MGLPIKEDSKDGDNIKLETNDPILTKKLLPTPAEKKVIADSQQFHEMVSSYINPKAMGTEQFFGLWKEESSEWVDGCLTKLFRMAKDDKSSKLKVIVIDGPIEPNWVENLNSVLDDNKKLCFGAGEAIHLTEKMKVIMEAAELRHCSPATISRCSVVYVEDGDDILPIKGHINKWIRSFPPILMPEADRLDMVINYFLINIKDRFLEPHMMVHPMSKKQAMLTFTQIMQSLISDYHNPKYLQYKKYLTTYKEDTLHGYEFGDYEISEDEEETK
jgi:hypothetical protein